MSRKILMPIQSFGLGDIIWEQTLVRKLMERDGYEKVIWGTEPHFVEGLNRAYPDITFINKTFINPFCYESRKPITDGIATAIPLRFADSIVGVPYSQCMKSKYMMYDMDWQTWKERGMWERTRVAELELAIKMSNTIGVDLYKPFAIVNTYFGSNSQLQIPKPNVRCGQVIEMKSIEGFSLFDWALLLEEASEIHVVSSSIIYILELLELKANRICIHKRAPVEQNHSNYEYILTSHKYELI